MVEYAARWAEFEKSLKAVQKAEKIEFRLDSLSLLGRYDKFEESLSKYVDWRDKALGNALPILKNESSSVTGPAQKDKWSEYFTKAGQDASKTILGLVPDDDDTPKLRLFAEAMATQESAFFTNLGRVPLAWFQGKAQEYACEFYKEKVSLEGKWKALGDKDKSVDAKIKETTAQVLAAFKNAVQQLSDKERRVESLLREAANQVKSIPGMPALASAGALVYEMLANAEVFQKTLDELVKGYLDAYKNEETIIIMFTQIRSAVHQFLNKTNLDTAEDEFEKSCKDSLDAAKQCKTKGQQYDAVKFIEKAIPLVKGVFEDFKKQYEQFIRGNQGIFVGAVVDKTIEELLEKRDVTRNANDIANFNIQKKLKEIHGDAVKSWHIDIDGLTDEQQKVFENFWEIELGKLGRGLTKVSDGPATDRMKQVLVTKWQLLETWMKNSKGGLQ